MNKFRSKSVLLFNSEAESQLKYFIDPFSKIFFVKVVLKVLYAKIFTDIGVLKKYPDAAVVSSCNSVVSNFNLTLTK